MIWDPPGPMDFGKAREKYVSLTLVLRIYQCAKFIWGLSSEECSLAARATHGEEMLDNRRIMIPWKNLREFYFYDLHNTCR